MSHLPAERPTLRRTAALTALAVTLAIVGLPTAAVAAPLVGGSTSATAVPLPLPADDIEGSFEASNVGISTASTRGTTTQPYWNNVAWYSYTPSETQTVYIRATSISPGGWDNTLEIWTAGGGFVTQNDDSYGLDAALTVTLNAGTSYRIGMGGYNSGSRGTATVTFASHPPSAPGDVLAVAGDGTAAVTWSTPADVAGGVTSYTVLCTPAGGTEVPCGVNYGTPPSRSRTVTGLTNGTAYSIRVTASNAIGTSEPSTPTSVTPRASSTVVITRDVAAPVSGEPYCVTLEAQSHGARVAGGTVEITSPEGTITHPADTLWTECVSYLVGDYGYTAAYSGTAAVAPSTGSATVTVAKQPQTVEFSDDFVGVRYTPDAWPLSATASTGLTPVTFTASGVCTAAGSNLTFTAVGECTVTGAQAGDAQTEPASTTVVFDVAKRQQGMHLGISIEGPLVYDRPPVTVDGGSDLGLSVTFTGTGSCTMVGNVMYATGVGPCTVTVSQVGNSLTEAAELSSSMEIGKRPQTLTISGLAPVIVGAGQHTVTGTSDMGLPVTLGASGACTLVGSVVSIVNVGTCTLTASQAGDEHTEPTTATATATVYGASPTASLRIGFAVGDQAEGSPVTVTGAGLRPDTTLTLTVYSTPTQVGTTAASVSGTAVTAAELPFLAAGEHRLVARGTALDGSWVTGVVRFAVDETGMVTRIGAPADLADSGVTLDTPGLLALAWLVLGLGLIAVRRTVRRRTQAECGVA